MIWRLALTKNRKRVALAAVLATLLGAMGAAALLDGGPSARAGVTLPLLDSVDYGPQKVIYHVNTRGNWRDRSSEAWRLVHVLNNHIRAIEPDDIDIRVILQGDGIDTLTRAKTDPNLASALDQLKKRGVKFRICTNTMQSYRVTPEQLHGATRTDFVQAAVAEIAALQKQGFSYIRF